MCQLKGWDLWWKHEQLTMASNTNLKLKLGLWTGLIQLVLDLIGCFAPMFRAIVHAEFLNN